MFEECIYFNLATLTRKISKIWQDEFERLSLSPSHGYLLVAIADNKHISQKQLSELMELDASTITRFVDSLAVKGLVERKNKGKGGTLAVTKLGRSRVKSIQRVMNKLFDRVQNSLGKKKFRDFISDLQEAHRTL